MREGREGDEWWDGGMSIAGGLKQKQASKAAAAAAALFLPA